MATTWIVLSILLVISLLIPLIRSQYWIVKALEYPMLQQLGITVFLLVTGLIIFQNPPLIIIILLILLIVGFIYQIYKILPYTSAFHPEMKSNTENTGSIPISIYVSNVYQYNTQYQKTLDQIRKYKPDFIVLLETNKKWADQLNSLRSEYYSIEQPQENTYGMLFYSKYKIEEQDVHFLIKNDIPSIEAIIHLGNEKKIKFWIIHPEPPFPGESDDTEKKDKELIQVAGKIRNENLPAIVAGDLNDVAWSKTTLLFKKLSNMIDPRIGRGFYNTFHAKNPFIRFPLDHIFFSTEFKLVKLERGTNTGSDHFPLFIQTSFNGLHKNDQHSEDILEEDKAEIQEIMQK